jgi:hypothetical protein
MVVTLFFGGVGAKPVWQSPEVPEKQIENGGCYFLWIMYERNLLSITASEILR